MTYTEVRQRSAVEKSSLKSSPSSTQTSIDEAIDRVPSIPPPFTIGDLRRAIPAHCFNRSFIRSFSYVIIDLLLAAALAFAATKIDVFINTDYMPFLMNRPSLLFFIRTAVWTAYWACQGAVLTGVWVIGHECGHGAFSSVDLLSDIVGFILHTALLVPYFSWKISHRKHHSNTGNLDKDEVFVPGYLNKEGVDRRITLLEKKRARRLRAKLEKEANNNNNNNETEDLYDIDPDKTPIQWFFDSLQRFLSIAKMLTLGWPAYLIANATSHPHYPNGTNHFSPFSKIFTERERPLVVLSDMGLLVMMGVLAQAVKVFGFANVVFYYFIPYLIVNGYLVLITFLQHTDAVLPHYNGAEWDWLRGALATIDRDYSILNIFHHHIGDTHIAHHLFSYIPHYHAQEATEAIKKVLGAYYRKDDTPITIALWKQFAYCEGLIEDETKKGVYWF